MDEMKIKLSTKFMRDMVAKILSKVIFNKFGIKPNLNINDLAVEMKNGKIQFYIDMNGEIDDKVLMKVNRLIDS